MCAKAVTFPVDNVNYFVEMGEQYRRFFSSEVAEKKLSILKEICLANIRSKDDNFLNFLATVFLNTPRNAIKSFTLRYINRHFRTHDGFIRCLSKQILASMEATPTQPASYASFLGSKLSPCLENCGPGCEAVKKIDYAVIKFITEALGSAVSSLERPFLSPTTRNQIYELTHMSLQMLLQLLQLADLSRLPVFGQHFPSVLENIKKLFADTDAPMDSKTLAGRVLVVLYLLSDSSNKWTDILRAHQDDVILTTYSERLSLYAALVSLAPEEELLGTEVNGVPSIMIIATEVMNIGQRKSADSAFTLAVSRTVFEIAKKLAIISGRVGDRLQDKIMDYVWTHLDHYMDSVRHIAAQSLKLALAYSGRHPYRNDMRVLVNYMGVLKDNSKSFFVVMSAMVHEFGAVALLHAQPDVAKYTFDGFRQQALQAAALQFMTKFMRLHLAETNPQTINDYWIVSVMQHVGREDVDSTVLDLLKTALVGIIKADYQITEFMIPKVLAICEKDYKGKECATELKRALFLITVLKQSSNFSEIQLRYNTPERVGYWKGLIKYEMLEMAAKLAQEEPRALALSVVVTSLKTTEVYTRQELAFVEHFLTYNMDTQTTHFRQLVLTLMDKFLARFADSLRAAARRGEDHVTDTYKSYLSAYELLCCNSLRDGYNHRRRDMALTILLRILRLDIRSPELKWEPEHVKSLFLQLEDSYETTITLAYSVLGFLPYESSIPIAKTLESILDEAQSSVPKETVTACYNLLLLRDKRPEALLLTRASYSHPPSEKETSDYILMDKMCGRLMRQRAVARQSMTRASNVAPMFGTINCMIQLFKKIDVKEISTDDAWRQLVKRILQVVSSLVRVVDGVVCSDSPEGRLPDEECINVETPDQEAVRLMLAAEIGIEGNEDAESDLADDKNIDDFTNENDFDSDDDSYEDEDGVDKDYQSEVEAEEERILKAQKVLLCAWRTIKESSLLFGEVVSRLSITGEDAESGLLSRGQVLAAVGALARLLLQVKHRGALEQAYVGFNMVVKRLLQCKNSALHTLPKRLLEGLIRILASRDNHENSVTRRSAGMPFLIQAIVSSEYQLERNPGVFNECVDKLLAVGRGGPRVPGDNTRAHCLNILRALFRNTAFGEVSANRVGSGLVYAIESFDSDDWSERNSATLLFSALIVRVFGVQRTRSLDQLDARNRLTGRVFFQRYPHMYDFIMERLQKYGRESSGNKHALLPSLYPILLILARLYPSPLEGTVSNLKLVAFIPHLQVCLQSSVHKTRELAAQAMVPLFVPNQIPNYISEVKKLLLQPDTYTNYRHGILLLLTRILESNNLPATPDLGSCLADCMADSVSLVAEARGGSPCFILVAEYAALVAVMLTRFRGSLPVAALKEVMESLNQMVNEYTWSRSEPGRDYALANGNYLLTILKFCIEGKVAAAGQILRSLLNKNNDVVHTGLDYLLVLYEKAEADNKFLILLENLTKGQGVLEVVLACPFYIKFLTGIMKRTDDEQSKIKVTRLTWLISHGEISSEPAIVHGTIVEFEGMINEQSGLSHVYFESLLNYVGGRVGALAEEDHVKVMRLVLDQVCSTQPDAAECAEAALAYIKENLNTLLDTFRDSKIRLQWTSQLAAVLVTLLEHEELHIRQGAADVAALLPRPDGCAHRVIPGRALELLIQAIREISPVMEEAATIYLAIALMNFTRSGDLADEFNRLPAFAEETRWTHFCAEAIRDLLAPLGPSPQTENGTDDGNQPTISSEHIRGHLRKILLNDNYRSVLEELALPLGTLVGYLNGELSDEGMIQLHPKVKMLVHMLFPRAGNEE